MNYAIYSKKSFNLKAICKMFEEKLKQLNPDKPQLVYGTNEINSYIDGFGDLGCLV